MLEAIEGNREEAIRAVLEKALALAGEGTNILVLMPLKGGKLHWEGIPEERISTTVFLALQFIHWVMGPGMKF
jgi:hypothetical protein